MACVFGCDANRVSAWLQDITQPHQPSRASKAPPNLQAATQPSKQAPNDLPTSHAHARPVRVQASSQKKKKETEITTCAPRLEPSHARSLRQQASLAGPTWSKTRRQARFITERARVRHSSSTAGWVDGVHRRSETCRPFFLRSLDDRPAQEAGRLVCRVL